MAQDKKQVEQITDMEADFAQWYTDVCRKAELTTINLYFNYFFPCIPVPFLKDVIRDFVLNTKRLERF